MKLKAIIIDDESSARQTLNKLINDYVTDIEIIAEASSVDEGLMVLLEHKPDVVFLDIRLSQRTVFDLLSQLTSIDFEIIFTTAYDQYALKAIKFSALDYLIKPINPSELILAIEKVRKRNFSKDTPPLDLSILKDNFSNQFNKIILPTLNNTIVVEMKDIIYCEGDRNYTFFHLINEQKIHTSRTLKEYEEMFEDVAFLRIHKSHLINLMHVKKYISGRGGQVEMSNGAILEVSREKKKELFDNLKKLR